MLTARTKTKNSKVLKVFELFSIFIASVFILQASQYIPYPVALEPFVEYHTPLDLTGKGKCRVLNTAPVKKGYLYGGCSTSDCKAFHIVGYTEDFKKVENVCPDCKLYEVLRVYKVDGEKIELLYPEKKTLSCPVFLTPKHIKELGVKANDYYLACLRRVAF